MTNDPFRSPDEPPNPFTRPVSTGADAFGAGSAAINPYAPTAHPSPTAGMQSGPEPIRQHHLPHEASIKAIGTLYLIPGILLLLLGGITLVTIVGAFALGTAPDDDFGIIAGVIAIYAGLGGLQTFIGLGLRRLTRPARVFATIFSAFGLLLFPFGTLINAYILYLLHSEKGKMVFSDEYKQIIELTPHLRYKSAFVIVLFAAIAVVIVLMIGVTAVVGI